MALIAGSGSPWLKVAALSGASAVALGAYGAHALKPTGPDADYYVSTFDRASRYHLTHSLLIAAAPLARRPSLVGALATLGIVLFSGSCYAIALQQDRSLGKFAPYGGMSFIAAWLALAL